MNKLFFLLFLICLLGVEGCTGGYTEATHMLVASNQSSDTVVLSYYDKSMLTGTAVYRALGTDTIQRGVLDTFSVLTGAPASASFPRFEDGGFPLSYRDEYHNVHIDGFVDSLVVRFLHSGKCVSQTYKSSQQRSLYHGENYKLVADGSSTGLYVFLYTFTDEDIQQASKCE